jgi:hypothetical protein
MKTLHTVTAVIELGAGLALLSFPSPFAALLLGSALDAPIVLTAARIGGAGLAAGPSARPPFLGRDLIESSAGLSLHFGFLNMSRLPIQILICG